MGTPKRNANTPIGGRVMTLQEAAETARYPVGDPLSDPGLIEDDTPSPLQQASAVIEELAGSEGAENGKVQVYRERPGKRDVFLYECIIPDWPTKGFVHIAETYGTGTYRIRVYSGGHMRVNRLIDIEAPERVAEHSAHAAAPDAVAQIGAMLAASVERMGAMLVDTIKATQQAQTGQGNEIERTLGLIKAMRDAMGPPAAPVSPMASIGPMLEMMRALKEFMPSGDGGDSSDGWMGKMLDKFGPVVLDAIQQRTAAPALAAPETVTPAAPPATVAPAAPAAPPVQIPQTQQQEDEMYGMIIRPYLKQLVQSAAKGMDVQPFAEQIAENAPERMLVEFCDRADWLDVLAGYEPEVRNFVDWFSRLRAALDALTSEPEEGDADPAP